jgi:dephospho-CoA kinase
VAEAPEDAVVVQDIPLLVETGQGSDFHLVLVVDAPDDIRMQRMLELRGMTADAARSRMAAQATREERLAAADAVLDNSGTLAQLVAEVDRLWDDRLAPYARNLSTGERAGRAGGPVLVPARAQWADEARRLMNRILKALPAGQQDTVTADHIGSTSVPGLDAKDVIDLQLTVPDLDVADSLAPALAAGGFPVIPGITADNPKRSHPNPEDWRKRMHANADPGRPVNLHIRAAGSPGWRFALSFRDWLRAEPAAAAEYLALKRRLAAAHAGDRSTDDYAEAKEDWFGAIEEPLERWVKQSGWQPPSSVP